MDLVDLAACGDLEGVQEMLSEKSTTIEQINSLDKDGRGAIHYACCNDDVKLLEMLLKDDRVDVEKKTPKGDTCLHLASLYASLRAMKMLFDDARGIKLLDVKNRWGETCLHLCAGSGDKGAAKAAQLLLDAGADLTAQDQWKRGPMDVARDNAENPLVSVFEEYLEKQGNEVLRGEVSKVSKEAAEAKKIDTSGQNTEARKQQKNAIFAGLGGALKSLKKVSVTEKHMFSKLEGKVSEGNKRQSQRHDAAHHGKVLSKLIDFPGDIDEITKYLGDSSIDPGGTDAYGLTALMKFASWNKVDLIELVLPKLNEEQINAQCPDGKTALHWACEMASVSAVSRLVECDLVKKDLKDNKGRTPDDILDSGSGPIIQRLKKALHKMD